MEYKQFWCPWRLQYILGPKPGNCVFCIPEGTEEDRERLILYRGKKNFIIMNKYPYNNGHIMVAPYRHVMDITLLETEEANEMFALLQKSTEVLQSCLSPRGINIGINMGEAAGAGIRDHLHTHLVPRWNGDSSFMAVMGEVRLIPQYLDDTYTMLHKAFS